MFSKSIPFFQCWCQNGCNLGVFLRVKFGLKVLLRVKRLTFCNSGRWSECSLSVLLVFSESINDRPKTVGKSHKHSDMCDSNGETTHWCVVSLLEWHSDRVLLYSCFKSSCKAWLRTSKEVQQQIQSWSQGKGRKCHQSWRWSRARSSWVISQTLQIYFE